MLLSYIAHLYEKTRYSRPILLAASLLFILLITYKLITSFFFNKEDPPLKVVEVKTATLSDITKTARFIGTIRAKHSTTLIAKSSGFLDSLLNAGHRVKKGDLIAKIDNTDIEKVYELSLAAEKIAQDQYERTLKLQKTGTSSKSDLEEKKNAWITAQKTLADAKNELTKIHFYAPFDGIVGVFKAREGTQVQEGHPIVTLYDVKDLIIEFDIPPQILSKIKDNQTVFIKDKPYQLTHVQKMIDEETYMCPAYIDYDCDQCLIGESIDVDLVIEQQKDVIVLPIESVVIQDDKDFVYIVKEGKAVLTPVTVGLKEKKNIQITSGVKVGDQVIFTGQSRLYPDIPVIIHQEKADKADNR